MKTFKIFYVFKRTFFVFFTSIFFLHASSMALANHVEKIKPESIQEKFEKLESTSNSRLGVAAINTADHKQIQYRADERFPLCSTGKVMVVGAILKKSMQDPNLLRKHITYTQNDLDKSGYAPITKKYLDTGMTVAELAEAVIQHSDNAAMNLLMENVGGPKDVTLFARSIDDNAFRLDRWEPELNSAIPSDVRDTSTPLAMEKSLQQLAFGNALSSLQRKKLQDWMKDNTTGDSRIRAGVLKDWIVGDKTGTGSYGTTNDVGIIWPTKCDPIVVAIYFTQNQKNAVPRDDVIASATKILIDEFAQTDSCLKLKN